jgi:outer membrane lipoprotein-sorting protein
MTALLLLTGCAGGRAGEYKFRDWQAGLENMASVSFSAEITADYGEKVFQYDAGLHWSDGTAAVEILSPESIAGIKLHTSDDGATLEYDGASLELGSLNGTGLSPATALPLILRTLKGGRLLDSRSEREGETRYEVYTLAAEGGELTVWFRADSFTPAAAELSEGGQSKISCRISDWNAEDQLT